MLSDPASLVIATWVTAGTVMPPFTLWLAAAVMAWLPSESAALAPDALRIRPPLNVKASAPTSIPFASRSSAFTV